jgi:molecular chaperone GrpE
MARTDSTKPDSPEPREGWIHPEPVADFLGRIEEAGALREELVRRAADYQNSRRRLEREFEARAERTTDALLERWLGVLDALDLALGSVDAARSDDGFVEGVRLIREQIAELLRKEGVSEIPAEGRPFDPKVHEAMAMEDREDLPPNQVVEVYRKGYVRGDRTLRAAQVRVSRRAVPDESR